MATETNFVSKKGLKLDAPEPGDVVSVRVRKQTQRKSHPLFGEMGDGAENPQHYRMTELFRVVAVNGGSAVVEALGPHIKGRREVWPIALHDWFEASELAAALGLELPTT